MKLPLTDDGLLLNIADADSPRRCPGAKSGTNIASASLKDELFEMRSAGGPRDFKH